MSTYGQESITSLKDEQQVRQRPSVIFGTNDESGALHGIYEIIANAIDEVMAGYGDSIKIKVWKDWTIEVQDNGRGVPMGWNEKEQKYNWELVFCTLYASGKYNSDNYTNSLGLNGLGATAMQYASEYMEVTSITNGKKSFMRFEKGRPVGKLEVTDDTGEHSGTTIKFKPDTSVFINIDKMEAPPDHFINLLRRQAMLNAGLKIAFWHESLDKEIILMYENGIKDFVDLICPKRMTKQIICCEASRNGTDREEDEEYKLNMRCAFTFSRESSGIELYHNGSEMFEGGVTFEALRNGVVKAFTEYGIEQGKLTKSDKLQFKDVETILMFIGETSCPGYRTFFKNQTKGAITNPFIKLAFTDFISYQLKVWLSKNAQDAGRVFNEVLANKKAREEADKVSKKIVQSLSKAVGFGNKPKKFVDCKARNPFERELFIVEGDSALGSCKLSRDAEFQALMPVRGKIINCLKKELSTILQSDIIIDLLKVFGCGIEVESKYIEGLPKFDLAKLNWGKIIICTDADLDGMQIRCLIITMIYRLCPTLLKAGKVYIAETPLFEISYGKETYFAYTEKEKDAILGQLESRGIKIDRVKIQRSKGLGENDPEMMSKSTMHPATRRLIPVEYKDNDSDIAGYFNALLGDDIETRRLLIDEYFDITSVDID